jgi:type I restriction enzyme S subunit
MNKEFFSLKLSEIADVVAGQSPESIFYSNIEGVPFLQGNRTFGTLYPNIDTYTSKVTKLAKKDEVLMSVRAPVGDLNFAPCDLCIGRGLASIKAKNGNNKFIYYALKYNINNLLRQGSGTTFDSVNKDVINDFELIIPKDKTDRDKVTKVLTALDSKIELNNRINAELEAIAKTLYDYWFVQFDFPDKNGKPYKTSGGKMVWNEELKREIPEGWEVKLLGTEIEIERGISYTSKEINGDGIPMISLNSFNLNGTYKPEGIKKYSGKYTDKNNTKPGDLLIAATDVTRNADIIGRAILVPDYYKGDLVFSMDIAKIISKNIPSSFLMMLFNSNHYHNYIKWYASGTIVLHLNLDGTKRYNIELPPKELLQKYDSLYQPIANRIYKTAIENQKLTELRDWLLPMLMNGQVKVSEL